MSRNVSGQVKKGRRYSVALRAIPHETEAHADTVLAKEVEGVSEKLVTDYAKRSKRLKKTIEHQLVLRINHQNGR